MNTAPIPASRQKYGTCHCPELKNMVPVDSITPSLSALIIEDKKVFYYLCNNSSR